VQELVSLREEDPQVFHAAHEQVLTLLRLGQVTALRVDHVDGLRDPQAYLERLQMAARAQSVDPDEEVYVVIEKILAHDEDLRPEWTCHGTTGYEFMTALNGLFVDPGGLEALDRVYADFTGESESYHELAYRSKRQVMEELFPGEMRSLGRRLCGIARSDSMASGIDENHLRTALEEVTAALPVYRTYVRNAEVSETDRRYIGEAVATARVRHGGVPGSAFDFVERVLTLDAPSDAQEWLAFTMRWQQFTSPITAKGIEDTAFYRYNRLISMNEVGAEPLLDVTTPGNFHAMNVRRLATYPHSMNSTSTHDTKRSEDVRARINALSEIPAEWADIANGWREANARHRTLIEDVEAPDASEEYAIYQTLLGAWPLDVDTDDLRARMAPFVEKALREEKTHTTWSHPNEQYESAVHNFADRLFADQSFVEQVKSLSERIAVPFVVNSLAQVVLKATAPGVPDVYQGTEIWDFSLVDPDNRRPVDFDRFNSMMQSLPQDMSELLADWRSGGVKLGTLQRVLQFRRANPQLFSAGEYVPLAVTGELADHVVAFARRLDDRQALIIVPRLVAGFSDWPIADAWRDTLVVLPPDSRACWRNILMGATFKPSGEMRVSDALATFPIAVLSNEAPAAKVGSYAASRPAISFSLRPAVPLIPRPIPEQPADSGQ
jgi:(1->4)-alpha-D-glucan 1-alpha-D-glucosylmutase